MMLQKPAIGTTAFRALQATPLQFNNSLQTTQNKTSMMQPCSVVILRILPFLPQYSHIYGVFWKNGDLFSILPPHTHSNGPYEHTG
jgi:hypothetical protein